MRLALFKDFSFDMVLVREEVYECVTTMTRISEYVDVEFPPRDPVEVDRLMNAGKRARAEKLRAELATLENT